MPITNQQAFGMVDIERRGDPILTEFAAREAERTTRQIERALRFGSAYGRTRTGRWSTQPEASVSDIAWALGAARRPTTG